jgi:hypothetical protein
MKISHHSRCNFVTLLTETMREIARLDSVKLAYILFSEDRIAGPYGRSASKRRLP